MKKVDFARIRKLPPEQRVKALKEAQEELTKLIKERSEEVSESKDEIKDAQEFLKEAEEELRVIEEMELRAPETKKVDINDLFERGEKRTAEKPRGELEDIAATAPRQQIPQDQHAYVHHLAQRETISNIYDRINQIRDNIEHTGVISAYQQDRLNQFREALHEKEEAIKAGEYRPDRKAEGLLTAAEKAVMYASGEKQKSFYRTQH